MQSSRTRRGARTSAEAAARHVRLTTLPFVYRISRRIALQENVARRYAGRACLLAGSSEQKCGVASDLDVLGQDMADLLVRLGWRGRVAATRVRDWRPRRRGHRGRGPACGYAGEGCAAAGRR